VPASGTDDERSVSREVILILRLMLDRRMELRRGELLDAKAIRQGRFVNLAGMLDAVTQWLERLGKGSPPRQS
jgi:hypothetical protein